MTQRRAAVVRMTDRGAAMRRLLEAPAGVGPPFGDAYGLIEGIQAIESGAVQSTVVSIEGSELTLKDAGAPLAAGEVRYATIAVNPEEPFHAEEFPATAPLLEAVQVAALGLYCRYLPAGPGRASGKPWLDPQKRQAVLRLADGAIIVLSEENAPLEYPLATFSVRSLQLVTISADTPVELQQAAAGLASQVQGGDSVPQLAAFQLNRCHHSPGHRFGVALLARSGEDLLREIALFQQGATKALESGSEWKTPAGSYFTANPLGGHGVAFVFPGVGSPYPGIGADLFTLAPRLIAQFERMAQGNAGRYLHTDAVYDREPAREAEFYRDVVALGECAISISAALTMLVRDVFGVAPRSALGYSFGEAIMPAALGVWPEPTLLTDRLDRSPTFRSRLHGPMYAIRECWGIAEGEPLQWRSYSVRATAAEAFTAIREEDRAYLAMINSPEEVVIAGDHEACNRVLQRIGSAAVPMPIPLTMHCAPARSEREELARIHSLETVKLPGTTLFSSAGYQPVPMDRQPLAQAIADGYTSPVDFPRLVRRVYADGARLFLELGGRRNCSTWIEKILRGRPHAAIPFDSQGLNSHPAVLRAIARLFSHRVPLNLTPLTSP